MSENSTPGDAIKNLRDRIQNLDHNGLDLLFRNARSFKKWQDREVENSVLRELYEVMKWGPTSQNSNPARYLFLKSEEAISRTIPSLHEGNIPKVKVSPVVAIIAYDTQFFEYLPKLFPIKDVSGLYRDNPEKAESTAFRNSSLQGAYFMLAARALGLDVNGISGFHNDIIDKEFFADGRYKSNFLCCLGYGETEGLHPRGPRMDFDEVAEIL
ncbi:malonic semialdehyde reductase [Opitutia bacterium ISCC 51]|nr:malonic semialdehyde reductase [Opitutae bacterium ISCC 51]QXD30244.1 malonic semialdehyde reductase [Opitutae bacterium ISCC 52]